MYGRQPPNNDKGSDNDNFDQQFQNEINAIQNAMNSMMQGAFSSLFNELFNMSGREGSTFLPNVFEENMNDTDTVTIIDGRNMNDSVRPLAGEDAGYGGSDFKRLVHKAKQRNKENDTAMKTVSDKTKDLWKKNARTQSDVATVFNLLYQPPPPALYMKARNLLKNNNLVTSPAAPTAGTHSDSPLEVDRNDGRGWSFTSTTQRTIYRPDGTQETIITKKSNGNTETIKQYYYPDGRKEEIKENHSSRPSSSWWSSLFKISDKPS